MWSGVLFLAFLIGGSLNQVYRATGSVYGVIIGLISVLLATLLLTKIFVRKPKLTSEGINYGR